MMCSSHCLTIYLLTGTLFLTFIYTLLSTQPFFISGINADNIDQVKTSALGALILFGVLFVLSIVGIVRNASGYLSEEVRDGNDGRGGYRNLINANLDYQMAPPSRDNSAASSV